MTGCYLIRFDDLCPAMNWPIWDGIEETLLDEGVAPILAVVPDNQDPALCVGEANPKFWDRVREWQRNGWTVALHGYQHSYVTSDTGIVGLNPRSEFAGLPAGVQERKLRAALDIFKQERVSPDAWVAPAHSFDLQTVRILRSLGIDTISDGFSLHPFRDQGGVFWIPQQLWRFRRMPLGVWTICLHHNHWTGNDLQTFRTNVRAFKPAITSVQQISSQYPSRRRNALDAVAQRLLLALVVGKRGLKAR